MRPDELAQCWIIGIKIDRTLCVFTEIQSHLDGAQLSRHIAIWLPDQGPNHLPKPAIQTTVEVGLQSDQLSKKIASTHS
ncbi:hypothetical protein CKO42_19790 [Lamprobacter modestohalophilus]|uniref:Uncharacterized protein n=1 Tax=Lamprobacter modestohalophilus TaxID=1064514 RepID=A0A9X0WBY0_9GAMM|nr:hypothetical protein [Lamprobacter modestohalophilus]